MNINKLIDAKFECLVGKLKKIFSDKEMIVVEDILGFGEYDFALDVILDIFFGKSERVPPEIIELIKELLAMLKLNQKQVRPLLF